MSGPRARRSVDERPACRQSPPAARQRVRVHGPCRPSSRLECGEGRRCGFDGSPVHQHQIKRPYPRPMEPVCASAPTRRAVFDGRAGQRFRRRETRGDVEFQLAHQFPSRYRRFRRRWGTPALCNAPDELPQFVEARSEVRTRHAGRHHEAALPKNPVSTARRKRADEGRVGR